MPRTARPWFRFYVEAMRDPKMRRLTPSQRWLWVAILAAARESWMPGFLYIAEGVPMSWEDLADYAGMKVREVEQATDVMSELRMLDFDREVGAWCVPAWNDRQYESDKTTERTRKHRRRNVPTLLEGTPPETEADTDTSPNGEARESFESDFDALWKVYPRKVDRGAALKAYQARRRDGVTHGCLLAAVNAYAEASDGQDRQYVKHGATFLGRSGPWPEWVNGAPEDAARGPMTIAPFADEPASGPSFIAERDQSRPRVDAKPCPLNIPHCVNGSILDPDDPPHTAPRRCPHTEAVRA